MKEKRKKKTRRAGNRLVYQVEEVIKKVDCVGRSRANERFEVKSGLRDENDFGFYSSSQAKHVLSAGQDFARWLKTQGINDLYGVRTKHYVGYIEELQKRGCSNGHIINVETSLKIFSKGMAKISKDKGFEPRKWVPKERIVPTSSREQPVSRAMDVKEVERVFEKASGDFKDALMLQLAFGLRLREVTESRKAHIVEIDGRLFWKAVERSNMPNSAKGVTKAGRPRITPVMKGMEGVVRDILEKKKHLKPGEKICSMNYNDYKRACNENDLGGSHRLRHTYAQYMVDAKLEAAGIFDEGRDIIRRMVINHFEGKRKDTGIKVEEKRLYKYVNSVIDTVHGYLGHGRRRIDLCARYMSGM